MLGMDRSHPPLISLDEALALVETSLPHPESPELVADRDDPALDLSSMDGLALRASDGRVPRRLLGACYAGQDVSGMSVEPGTALRIMTGAVLPKGADAVVPFEDVDETPEGWVPRSEPRSGAFVRRKGDQARAGDRLTEAGMPRSAPWIGLAAQVGHPWPEAERVRVAIAPTGDELQADPAPWQIRDSNGPMLRALVRTLGAEPQTLPRLPDDPEALKSFFETSRDWSVLLTTGGVSKGDRDHVPQVLARLGARILFHRIRMKPGKPTLLALLDRRVVLALPGNPVSAYVNARVFLPGILARLEGRPSPGLWEMGHLVAPVANPDDRPLLHPCRLRGDRLEPLESRGSADLVRLAQAHACAWVPEGGLPAGPVRYLRIL